MPMLIKALLITRVMSTHQPSADDQRLIPQHHVSGIPVLSNMQIAFIFFAHDEMVKPKFPKAYVFTIASAHYVLKHVQSISHLAPRVFPTIVAMPPPPVSAKRLI